LYPSAATGHINGIDVTKEPLETKKYVAYIPETVMLYKNLTGLENLEYFSAVAGRWLHGPTCSSSSSAVGLQDEAADRRVGTYSRGMRKKVGIAIALAKNAKALLMDEPTSGLDLEAANEFSALLAQLSADGVAVLMATHDSLSCEGIWNASRHYEHGKLVATLNTTEIGHADLERIYLEHMHD
jgi:ABC-2 type transport system ATP-binding protein